MPAGKKTDGRPKLRDKMAAAYQQMEAGEAKSKARCKKCGEKGRDCECKKA